MPGPRRRPQRQRLARLPALMMGALACVAATPAAAATGAPPEAGLICHTDDAKDCYPRVFEPTHEFRAVHEDQELPGGLHVRLNIWTGQREAKINVPGEADESLQGAPVDRAVVAVDDAGQIPKDAPPYEAFGKVKTPQHEAEGFAAAVAVLRNGVAPDEGALDGALEELHDLSHDIYFGLELAGDADALRSLLCLATGRSSASPAAPGSVPRDQQAASILSSMLQNNPPALAEVAKGWQGLVTTECPGADEKLGKALYRSFVPARNDDAAGAKPSAPRVKAKVAAVNGLLKDAAIRRDFLLNGGMEGLLEVLVPEAAEWAGAQRQAGQLVLDNFLDGDMGAEPGQWPRTPRLADDECRARADEGCWDYHVARIMRASGGAKGHWSRELHERLAATRAREAATRGRQAKASPRHAEL